MADVKTTNETTETPITGAEYVRLATAGFNWKSTLTAVFNTLTKEKLTGARTYYVRANGSDSNDGLTDTAGGAFLTLSAATNVINTIDFNGQAVTIQKDSSTYTEPFSLTSGWTGGGSLTFDGGGGKLDTTSLDCIFVNGAVLPGTFIVQNVTMKTTTDGACISHAGVGLIYTGTGLIFDASANAHMVASNPGAQILVANAYSVIGSALYHYHIGAPGTRISAFPGTVTFTGAINFSQAFAFMEAQGTISTSGITFTGGTVTGTRFYTQNAALIQTFGGGANYFPGNVAGTTDSASYGIYK